jgi:tRNA (guanosine-2'-O-)-methyltransferase
MAYNHLDEFIDALDAGITAHKCELIKKILPERTRHVTLILEDTFQSLNASAITRTAEIFGLQDIHAIENRNTFKGTTGIARGAFKWLSIYRHASTIDCMKALKSAGYTIVATSPVDSSVPLEKIPVDQKLALLFGTEWAGLSTEAAQLADYTTFIPMYGFTKSFNLSVSVGICLQEIMSKIRADNSINWRLSLDEQKEICLQWTKKIIEHRDE